MEKRLGRKLTRSEIVHHIDKNKHNNNDDNLKLETRSEHSRHHNIGVVRPRLRGKSNKLDQDKVLEIRRLLDLKQSERKIAKLFNIGRGTVRCIKSKITWNWL